jgi:23S rRNA (uracil1939-C5)-methyltransferase
LKSLIIRESKTKDQLIAILCVKKEDFVLPFSLQEIPELDGLTVAFSNPLSPASLITKELSLEGMNYLEEKIAGLDLQYPLDGFFQNNIPLFGKALSLMQDVVNRKSEVAKIVELYSGVGTIGLALCKQAESVIGVEVVPSSIQYAKENARRNNISNYECYDIAAEEMDSKLLAMADIVVLDPPRIGLHADVVNSLIQYKPKTILYLSCNPETQARDCELLKEHYSPTALYGFDFYPQTNHMESLIILDAVHG